MALPIFPLAAQEPPEPVKTSITVVGKIAAETPANVSVVGTRELAATPGADLDERLRQVPGFTLFRRSSSLVAHPTTQGVSLRGIGSSGASRTLVLWDGVPANDPFGGWVYWTQFIPLEIERVEVARGAPASAFGDRAMGGVIALFSRPAEAGRLTASYDAGNRGTHDTTLGYAALAPRWAVSGWGRAFSTDGYFTVPEQYRGAVDRRAGVRFATGDARLDWFGAASRVFLKVNALAEERQNGTVLQTNSTALGTVALDYSREFRADSVSVLAFHTREQFHSAFSSIAADRNSERLTYRQTVPAEAVGGAALWRHEGGNWNLLGGADVYRVEGWSTDHLFPTGARVGGGRQLQHGVYAQAGRSLGPLKLSLGLREDAASRGGNFLSPRAGVTAGRGRLRGRASVYRGFRAPTLNELYREFRVGNTVTQANPALRPEKLFGAEAGADWTGERVGARLTFYRNALADLVTNVTLSSAPNLIVRQRGNAASVVARGVEMDAFAVWRAWRAEAAALFAESRVAAGERVPQVPKWQGSGRVIWQRGGTLASAGVRGYGAQFDDDRNQFRLPGFATVQGVVRQRVAAGLAVSAEVENLAGRTYLAGFTPLPLVGAPRLWRVGLRWDGTIRKHP